MKTCPLLNNSVDFALQFVFPFEKIALVISIGYAAAKVSSTLVPIFV